MTGLSRRRFLAITAAAALVPTGVAARVSWTGVALGADVRLTVVGDRDAAEDALVAARRALAQAERALSLYDPASALSALNRTGALAPPPLLRRTLDLCATVHAATKGRFDPTVQPLWRALATGGDGAGARRLVGFERVSLGPRVTLGAGQALTLNGIGQGVATDHVANALLSRGFSHALVAVGETRGLGGPWRLALADPNHGNLGLRTLHDGAIATSSPDALHLGDARHIVDPLGRRAPQWSTVSVEADGAGVADGLSTALCFATDREIRAMGLRHLGVRRVTLVDRDGDLHTVTI
ncbi:MAG: FAD:protein FMN transferase [Pseudomonadota bacterium]